MTTQFNPFEFFSAGAKNMGMDREKHIEAHRKNLETMAQAHKSALEVMRTVSQMQQQYMRQAFENMSSMVKNLVQKGGTQESWENHGENLKKHLNDSIDHGMRIAATLGKAQKESSEVVKERMAEHMKDVSEKMQDIGKKAAKSH